MSKQFIFKRKELVYKIDETIEGNDKRITIKDEAGNPVPNQWETEEKEFTDSFNMDMVIRSVMMHDNLLLVLLDDGHEVTEAKQKLKNPNKPPTPANIEDVKTRIYVQSEISLTGEDIKRFWEAIK